MKIKIFFIMIFNYIFKTHSTMFEQFQHLSEEGKMNFTQLGHKYGHSVEEHEVTTGDGYILQLFRIPGRRKTPVLLMHGLMDNAEGFIIRGKSSLAISLAEAGNDVWVGNSRGNKYSRRHVKLNPDTDKEFWDYSFHENGYYDLPAMIDYILQTTGEKKLKSIGHSQGTTMHFVLLSSRPQYNEKVKLFIGLAPIAFLSDLTVSPWSDIIPFTQNFFNVVKSIGIEEFFPAKSSITSFARAVCSQNVLSYQLCIQFLTFGLIGRDSRRFERSFLKTVIGHFPDSTSRKSLVHYGQLMMSKRFCTFDYGVEENLNRYGYSVPIDYNVRQISAKVALLGSKNDKLSRIKDVEILRTLMPNIVHYHIMQSETWNHIDYILANDLSEYFVPYIFQLLDKYE